MNPSFTYDISQLQKFARAINDNKWYVKIGILGSKGAETHKGSASTNAEIGLVHEMGSFTKHIPMRSFLRMPLFHESQNIMKKIASRVYKLVMEDNRKQLMTELGIECETIILNAFATRGFGTWAPLQPKTIESKIGKNPAPLINSAQLERSISSKVERI